MKMQMLKVGEPDKNGEREYTFSVLVNRQPVLYQVRARHEGDAASNLSRYVEADAATLQELGAGETGATIVLLGAVAAVGYLVVRHLRLVKKPAAPSVQPGKAKAARPKNGIEVAAAEPDTSDDTEDTGEAGATSDGAPDERGFTVSAARSSSSPFAPRSFNNRAPARGAAAGAPRGAAAAAPARGTAAAAPARGASTSGEIIDAPVTAWRPLTYHGAQGKLAGDATAQALRIVVFSDLPLDPFLTLARPSSYDATRGVLQDAVAVLAFPTAAAENVRSPGAVEVMIGGSPTRDFDVTAATADEALTSVRTLLARYL